MTNKQIPTFPLHSLNCYSNLTCVFMAMLCIVSLISMLDFRVKHDYLVIIFKTVDLLLYFSLICGVAFVGLEEKHQASQT